MTVTVNFETVIAATLQSVCPLTFPDVAPEGTPEPYLVWKLYGGRALRYVEDVLPDRRNNQLEVSIWSPNRIECNTLMQQVELALITAPDLQCKAITEMQTAFDEDVRLRGVMQEFDVWGPR